MNEHHYKLVEQLNDKIFECERLGKIVEIMSKRIHDYEEKVKRYAERVEEGTSHE